MVVRFLRAFERFAIFIRRSNTEGGKSMRQFVALGRCDDRFKECAQVNKYFFGNCQFTGCVVN
ncbi:hypothetical protein CUJ90_04915 [Paraburkholderia terricola]|nr:hypothetical protein CUJ90_04915 [Paraburkholderia terricola]